MDGIFLAGSTAVISSLFLQFLKKSNYVTFLSTEAKSSSANRIVSILIAFVTSIGLTYTFNSTTGQLVVNGLILGNVVNVLYHSFTQWVAQHIAYKTIVVPTELYSLLVNQLKILNATSSKILDGNGEKH